MSGEVLRRNRMGDYSSDTAGQVLVTTKNVYISGSFKDFIAIGNHQLNSNNRSTDGFIAQLDRDDFYNVNWARGFGFDGEDQTDSVVGWGHDEVVTGVLGEGNSTKSEFFRMVMQKCISNSISSIMKVN